MEIKDIEVEPLYGINVKEPEIVDHCVTRDGDTINVETVEEW